MVVEQDVADVRSETSRGESTIELDDVFGAIAESTRRTILDVLSEGERQTAGQITEQVAVRLDRAVSRQTVSRHLRVLRDAELVSAIRVGNAFRYGIDTGPLESIYRAWLGRYLPQGALAVDRRDAPTVTVETSHVAVPAEEPGARDAPPPADETPADETPAAQLSADETPADETPAAQLSADETPADETPAAQLSADETPADERPATPAEPTPDAGEALSIENRLARLHRRLRQDAEQAADRPVDDPTALPRSPRARFPSR